MANNKRSTNFSRGYAIMDFILEGDGHSIAEATKEFKLSRSTIEADLNYVGQEAFYGNRKNPEQLREKYVKMRKTLASISKINHSNAKLQKAVSN